MAVKIERRIVVSGGGCNPAWPWIAHSVELIDGTEFIQLVKKDSGLARFVSGTAYGARSMSFLETLRSQRTAASIELAKPGGNALFDEGPCTKRARKSLKQNAAALHKKGELPAWVCLEQPGFEGVDGNQVPATTLKVKTALDLQTPLSVELAPEQLGYIREAMRASDKGGRQRARPEKNGLRWRAERRAWLASRWDPEAGKMVSRSFQPDDPKDNDDNKELARQRALAWVADADDGLLKEPQAQGESAEDEGKETEDGAGEEKGDESSAEVEPDAAKDPSPESADAGAEV